ncbi:MAG: hypothetical protein R3F61_23135 [Myxococcota bacterium]
MGGIGQLLQTLGQLVPPWVLALLLVALGVAMAPGWLVGLRVKRVKAVLRKTVRADEAERRALQQQALDHAHGNGEVLIALVKEADKLNQPALRDRALKELEALGTHRDEVRKLKKPEDPARNHLFAHPVEAFVSIERLLESGATEAARERLREARRRFPDDPGLHELHRRLRDTPPEGP